MLSQSQCPNLIRKSPLETGDTGNRGSGCKLPPQGRWGGLSVWRRKRSGAFVSSDPSLARRANVVFPFYLSPATSSSAISFLVRSLLSPLDLLGGFRRRRYVNVTFRVTTLPSDRPSLRMNAIVRVNVFAAAVFVLYVTVRKTV